MFLLLLSATSGLAQRTGTISGTLIDSVTGQPIERAAVTLTPVPARDHLTGFTTASDGHFQFSGLVAGKYNLMARAHGYLTQAFNQHEIYSSAIAVGPGLEPENLIFRLTPECVITGAVTDEAGEPVRGAQVSLYHDSINAGFRQVRAVQNAVTDDQGSYHFGHLEAGQYFVVVSARVWYAQRPEPTHATNTPRVGRYYGAGKLDAKIATPSNDSYEAPRSPLDVVYPLTFYPGATDPSSASPITVNPGERFIANVRLQPVPAAHLTISSSSVRDGTLLSAHIEQKTLWGEFQPPEAASIWDGPGKTLITGIPPGRYKMKIIEMKASGGEEVRESEMEVASDGTIDQGRTESGVHLTAMLKDVGGTGKPLHGALRLYDPATRANFSAQIPSSGEVQFGETVAPGRYVVTVAQSGGAFVQSVSGTGAKIAGGMVTLEAGSQAKLLVTLGHGYARITGTAQKNGKPFAGAMVLLIPEQDSNIALFQRDQSDSDGTFTLQNVVPGKYRVVALEHGWELEWMNPAVRKRFAGGAVAIEVSTNENKDLKLNVQ
jgi:hypothetical protein